MPTVCFSDWLSAQLHIVTAVVTFVGAVAFNERAGFSKQISARKLQWIDKTFRSRLGWNTPAFR
jgi:hypothetical protein